MSAFFFFQAEDGIRDWSVTGVQTCALPISELTVDPFGAAQFLRCQRGAVRAAALRGPREPEQLLGDAVDVDGQGHAAVQIGRASCRERGETPEGADGVTERK